ncbi:MAG: hypothetical protein K2J77_03995 [Oscillospiraceae bacterium]|nr:hypothetical protein [Oscillospiraceae bacterium]
MKKIIAGVLAAASMLAVSATAFATDKTVSKAGELTYDVAVTAPKVVLNLVMPAKMAAALNPYGADIKLDAADTPTVTTATIASTAYKVTNKSTEYGVYIDATAITTVTTTDKTPWKVEAKAAPTDGTKGAQLTLIGADTVADIKSAAEGTLKTASASASTSGQGVLVMDSTVAKSTTVAAGQTSQNKVFFIAAASNAETPTDMYMAFAGKLAKTPAGNTDPTKEVEWKEDDAINVNLVLKVSAGPKAL